MGAVFLIFFLGSICSLILGLFVDEQFWAFGSGTVIQVLRLKYLNLKLQPRFQISAIYLVQTDHQVQLV